MKLTQFAVVFVTLFLTVSCRGIDVNKEIKEIKEDFSKGFSKNPSLLEFLNFENLYYDNVDLLQDVFEEFETRFLDQVLLQAIIEAAYNGSVSSLSV